MDMDVERDAECCDRCEPDRRDKTQDETFHSYSSLLARCQPLSPRAVAVLTTDSSSGLR